MARGNFVTDGLHRTSGNLEWAECEREWLHEAESDRSGMHYTVHDV